MPASTPEPLDIKSNLGGTALYLVSQIGWIAFLLLSPLAAASIATAIEARPNFLFVAVDDLNDFCGYARDEPGNFLQFIYPDAEVRRQVGERLTPNLNRLAARSAPFVRAYCPSPLCGPSRTSLLTGVPPHISGYYQHDRHFRLYDSLANAVTLPQLLRQHGYFTTGLGKIFHKGQGIVDGPLKDDWADARNSWSVWINHPNGCGGWRPSKYSPPNGGLMQFGPSRLSTKQSGDWQIAEFAAQLLEQGTASTTAQRRGRTGSQSVTFPEDQPFFLACGLFRPHLPFFAPQEFFDLFPTGEMTGLTRESLLAMIADLDDLPANAQRFSDYRGGKMKTVLDHARRVDGEEGEVAAWREVVQAYLACVAFADTCIGRVMEGAEASPQRDNIVVVLWSDHGFHLGSKYHFAKQTLWEEANRVQLLIHDPRARESCTGEPRRQLVSLNDLYPTICNLADVPLPENAIVGTDLTPLLHDPQAPAPHAAVLMTYQSGNHAARTPDHRYLRYRDGSTELYDMRGDPEQQNNLAGEMAPQQQASLAQQLDQLLQAGGGD